MPKTFKPAQPVETGPRPNIPLVRVKSRQIAAVGYDEATETLALQFTPRSGDLTSAKVYLYPGWSKISHYEFMKAESLGTHFGTFIKPISFKVYPAEPIPEA